MLLHFIPSQIIKPSIFDMTQELQSALDTIGRKCMGANLITQGDWESINRAGDSEFEKFTKLVNFISSTGNKGYLAFVNNVLETLDSHPRVLDKIRQRESELLGLDEKPVSICALQWVLRWFGTVLGRTKCANFFCQNLLFMAQAVRKWNNIWGSPCSIFLKMGPNIAIFDLLKYGVNGKTVTCLPLGSNFDNF